MVHKCLPTAIRLQMPHYKRHSVILALTTLAHDTHTHTHTHTYCAPPLPLTIDCSRTRARTRMHGHTTVHKGLFAAVMFQMPRLVDLMNSQAKGTGSLVPRGAP